MSLLLDFPEAIAVSALTGTGLEKATAAIERRIFEDRARFVRSSQTWEEFEKKRKSRKNMAQEKIILDDTEPFL